MTIQYVFAIIAALSAMFFTCVIACCYSLGRFHSWLKQRGELFGDNDVLYVECSDIRERIIDLNNKGIL